MNHRAVPTWENKLQGEVDELWWILSSAGIDREARNIMYLGPVAER